MTNGKQRLALLGASGSIGQATLNVVRCSDRYEVRAMSGYKNSTTMIALIREFRPAHVVMVDEQAAAVVAAKVTDLDVQVEAGPTALIALACAEDIDTVIAGIVGCAGLASTLAAIHADKRILLANKESLVVGGHLVRQAIAQSQARVLPIDSEHNALFQCMPARLQQQASIDQAACEAMHIERLVLTASGGPFLHWNDQQLATVTIEQACKHPNWSMGQKISVDSASLMNKGLELIEACFLFGVDEQFVEVVVHPQSIVHSMVTYIDGTTLAQLSAPSMCVPIAHALAWPERHSSGVAGLNWQQARTLEFMPLDTSRFPCFELARGAMRSALKSNSCAPAVLNAANEQAVASFLHQKLEFIDIPKRVSAALDQFGDTVAKDVADLIELDQQVRAYVRRL